MYKIKENLKSRVVYKIERTLRVEKNLNSGVVYKIEKTLKSWVVDNLKRLYRVE